MNDCLDMCAVCGKPPMEKDRIIDGKKRFSFKCSGQYCVMEVFDYFEKEWSAICAWNIKQRIYKQDMEA